MNRILILTADIIADTMAGPAIRALEMGKFLSGSHDITLAFPDAAKSRHIHNIECRDLWKLKKRDFEDFDIIINQSIILHKLPFKKKKNQVLVMDMYNNFIMENFEYYRGCTFDERVSRYKSDIYKLKYHFLLSDYFLCANERQKDFISGMLIMLCKINPDNMCNIMLVPFGISDNKPLNKKKVLRSVISGINENDRIVIWGGGIWDWLDPLTAVKAFKIIASKRDDVKLVFMGATNPNHEIPTMKNFPRTVELSDRLDLTNKTIFFQGWAPYNDRADYLLESDIGLSLHFNNTETRFSNRTRVMDYLWCELPVISTVGDTMADFIYADKLGRLVECEAEKQLADTIMSMLDNNEDVIEYKHNIRKFSENHKWGAVFKPLNELCDFIFSGNRQDGSYNMSFAMYESSRMTYLKLLRETLRIKGVKYGIRKILAIFNPLKI